MKFASSWWQFVPRRSHTVYTWWACHPRSILPEETKSAAAYLCDVLSWTGHNTAAYCRPLPAFGRNKLPRIQNSTEILLLLQCCGWCGSASSFNSSSDMTVNVTKQKHPLMLSCFFWYFCRRDPYGFPKICPSQRSNDTCILMSLPKLIHYNAQNFECLIACNKQPLWSVGFTPLRGRRIWVSDFAVQSSSTKHVHAAEMTRFGICRTHSRLQNKLLWFWNMFTQLHWSPATLLLSCIG